MNPFAYLLGEQAPTPETWPSTQVLLHLTPDDVEEQDPTRMRRGPRRDAQHSPERIEALRKSRVENMAKARAAKAARKLAERVERAAPQRVSLAEIAREVPAHLRARPPAAAPATVLTAPVPIKTAPAAAMDYTEAIALRERARQHQPVDLTKLLEANRVVAERRDRMRQELSGMDLTRPLDA